MTVAFLGSWFMLLSFAEMFIFAIVGTCRSIVGTVGVIATYSRWVLPRNVIRQVSTELDEVEGLLNRAEAINAIQDESEYRMKLTRYGNPCNMWAISLTDTAFGTSSYACAWPTIALQEFFNNSSSSLGPL